MYLRDYEANIKSKYLENKFSKKDAYFIKN